MDGAVNRKIIKATDGAFQELADSIAVEKKLRLSVNGRNILTLYCTPIMIRELVVGLLMTEFIIRGKWCAEHISIIYGDEISVGITTQGTVDMEGAVLTSGCAGGVSLPDKAEAEPITGPFSIDAKKLTELYREFQMMPGLYRLTGCVHSAALSDGINILCRAEDIGRHNAVDKVIGYCIIEEIGLKGKIMLTSGRLSSEIASKCSRWGIPLIASRAAPTDLALNIAEKNRMTVVGFLRAERLNIYTHPERVIVP